MNAWQRFWFEPVPATNLGVVRLLIFAGSLLFFWNKDFAQYADTPAAYWNPCYLFMKLHLSVFSAQTLLVLGWIWKVSLVTSAIGLFTRVSTWIAFLLSLYLLGLPNNIGKIDHGEMILIFSYLILAVARSGDAWSVDRLIARRLGKAPPEVPVHGEYKWPIRMGWVLITILFCAAGIAKLRTYGFAWPFPKWAMSDNLRNLFLQMHYLGRPPLKWGLWLAQYPTVCKLMALATVVVEVSLPLAIVSRWARWVLVPSIFIMQLGNDLLLGVPFRQFMLAYVFFIPWDWVGMKLFGRGQKR